MEDPQVSDLRLHSPSMKVDSWIIEQFCISLNVQTKKVFQNLGTPVPDHVMTISVYKVGNYVRYVHKYVKM